MTLNEGDTIGRLTLLKKNHIRMSNGKFRAYWECKCSCGNTKKIREDILKSGKQVSCGCYNDEMCYFKLKDITNKRFGRLVAIEATNKRNHYNGSVIWKCKCDCGNIAYVSISNLKEHEIFSCGCLSKESHSKNGKIIGALTKENCIEGTNIRNLTMKISKKNTSGIKGVSWDSSRQKWAAQIVFKNKHYFLGRYLKKEDAAKVRKEAEEKLFGNFLEWYKNRKKD